MVINPFRNRVQFIIERLLLSGTFARLAIGAAAIGIVALGVLVAVLTQGLNEWIRKLEMGLTPISICSRPKC